MKITTVAVFVLAVSAKTNFCTRQGAKVGDRCTDNDYKTEGDTCQSDGFGGLTCTAGTARTCATGSTRRRLQEAAKQNDGLNMTYIFEVSGYNKARVKEAKAFLTMGAAPYVGLALAWVASILICCCGLPKRANACLSHSCCRYFIVLPALVAVGLCCFACYAFTAQSQKHIVGKPESLFTIAKDIVTSLHEVPNHSSSMTSRSISTAFDFAVNGVGTLTNTFGSILLYGIPNITQPLKNAQTRYPSNHQVSITSTHLNQTKNCTLCATLNPKFRQTVADIELVSSTMITELTKAMDLTDKMIIKHDLTDAATHQFSCYNDEITDMETKMTDAEPDVKKFDDYRVQGVMGWVTLELLVCLLGALILTFCGMKCACCFHICLFVFMIPICLTVSIFTVTHVVLDDVCKYVATENLSHLRGLDAGKRRLLEDIEFAVPVSAQDYTSFAAYSGRRLQVTAQPVTDSTQEKVRKVQSAINACWEHRPLWPSLQKLSGALSSDSFKGVNIDVKPNIDLDSSFNFTELVKLETEMRKPIDMTAVQSAPQSFKDEYNRTMTGIQQYYLSVVANVTREKNNMKNQFRFAVNDATTFGKNLNGQFNQSIHNITHSLMCPSSFSTDYQRLRTTICKGLNGYFRQIVITQGAIWAFFIIIMLTTSWFIATVEEDTSPVDYDDVKDIDVRGIANWDHL